MPLTPEEERADKILLRLDHAPPKGLHEFIASEIRAAVEEGEARAYREGHDYGVKDGQAEAFAEGKRFAYEDAAKIAEDGKWSEEAVAKMSSWSIDDLAKAIRARAKEMK
jgi:flagellar biosynthesis/type III secretory pathway protein FliH